MALIMVRYVFLFLLVLTSTAAQAQSSRGDKLFQDANTATDQGDADNAIRLYLSARSEYLKEENFKRVLTCTQNVAMYYQDTGDPAAAEKLILQTIQAVPKATRVQLEVHASLQDNLAYTFLLLNRLEDALHAYNESISFYEKAGLANTASHAFELVNRGTVYFNLYRYADCIQDMHQAIAMYERHPETTAVTLTECYRTLATAYSESGNQDEALKNFNKGYQLAVKSGEPELQSKLLNDVGNTLKSQEKYLDALQQYEMAKKINESNFGKESSSYAINLINVGSVHKAMGDLEAALESYQEVLSIYEKNPPEETIHLIDVISLIASIANDFGRFDESNRLLDEAMKLAISTYGNNSLVQADVYMSQAVAAFNRHAFDQSLTYNFKALSIMQSNNYPELEDYAIIYNNVGQAYDELGNIDLALQYKQQALELYTKLNGAAHPSVAMATGNIGLTYEIAEDYDKAIDFLNQSVAIRLKVPGPYTDNLGKDYLNLGLMYLKKQDAKTGVEYLEKARTIYDRYAKHINKAMIYNRLAHGYRMLNNTTKSKQLVQLALIANVLNFDNSNFESNPDKPDFLSYYELNLSYLTKVDVYTTQGDRVSLEKAGKLLAASDQLLKVKAQEIAKQKDRLELAQLNSFFTEAAMLWAEKYFRLTNDPAILEKAFYFSERSKANELLTDIQLAKAATLSGIPWKLEQQRAFLSSRMNTLQQQIASAYAAANQPLIAKLKAQELDLDQQVAELQTRIKETAPVFAALNQRVLPGWTELKKTLDEKTAIVSYTLTDSAKFILIGNRSQLVIKTIPPKTNLDKLVRLYLNQIKYQGSGMKQVADRLTDLVWTPVAEVLKEWGSISQVIIIPEGSLSYLPFESLGKDRYLLEQYTIRYHYSGALLVQAGPSQEKPKPTLIALAPVFEDKATNFVNKSCQRFAESTSRLDSVSRAFTSDGQYITPLPATETEVQQINQTYQDRGLLSKRFIKEAAHEALIKKGELGRYDYVHLATHGLVNTQYPELSGLLLTQDGASAEDGILYTGEILGLSFQASLVTLSACETALGRRVEGEGVRGLTTAFLFSGARNVVASLWKVADESTAQLMIAFYNELLSGKDKATALRNAKLQVLKSSYSHPFYWAPFVQVGAN